MESWVVDQAIALDWYDGPRAGFFRLQQPLLEFAFDVLAERPTADSMDERLFSLSFLPQGSISKVMEKLAFAGPPAKPVWVPKWQGAEEERATASAAIKAAKAKSRQTAFVVASEDFTSFWGLARVPDMATVSDWLPYLQARSR